MEKRKPLNGEIRASKVQVIHEQWGNIWEMTLKEALEKAQSEGLDLMEIGRNDDVTIVKILDYGKFLYKQKKQDQKNKQKSKTPDPKTLKITFRISEHDLEVRKKQAEWFAEDGNPLKVMMQLRWRENQYVDLAKGKMRHFIEMISEFYKIERELVHMGNNLIVNLKPIK